MIDISDFSDERLAAYAGKTENELRHLYEPHGGAFIAESPKVIERALRMGCEPVSMLVDRGDLTEEAEALIASMPEIPVFCADSAVFRRLTGFAMTRGALCLFRRPELPDTEALLLNAGRIAVLEDVVNPTNVGAIFRSAAAIGIDAVLLTQGCSDPFYRRAARVSMGTVFQIPWTRIELASDVRAFGYKTAALALNDRTISIEDPVLKKEERLALILGTEGDGLRKETIGECDYSVKIPMAPGIDSLNVAAAAAVAFWELRKR